MKGIRLLAMMAALGATLGAAARRLKGHPALERDASARGRYARSPLDMTWLGWKDILLRTWHESFNDRLLSVAAGVAFFGLLALVPSLSVLVSFYGLVANPAEIETQLAPLFGFMPESAVALVMEQAHRLASQPSQTLSYNLLLSLAIAIWSANAGIKALFDALNVIYDEDEKRSLLVLNAVSLLTTVSAAVVVVITLLVIAVVPQLLKYAPFNATFDWILWLVRWPAFFLFASVSIAVLFWIGPSRRRARFHWVLPGAALSALLWAGVSALFSVYVSTLGNYQVTYGSLSTVIVFMTWLWISASVILLGAQLNSELEHQTAQDTTEGQPKAMGRRGATMADKIGPRMARD